MSTPIATIDFDREGRHHRATLGADLRWVVPGDPDLGATLNALFPVDASPALGSRGHAVAHEAAQWLGGTVQFTPTTPAPAGADH